MKRSRLAALLLVLAAAGSMAFAGTFSGRAVTAAQTVAPRPESAETALRGTRSPVVL